MKPAPLVLIPLVLMACSARPQAGTNTDEVREGSVECLICGVHERHRSVGGKLDRVEPYPVSDYTKWYDEKFGLPHDHDWTSTGCHVTRTGSTTMFACHPVGGTAGTYQDAIRNFPDQAIAARLVRGLIRATHDQRSEVLATGFMGWKSGLEFWDLPKQPPDRFPQAWEAFLEKSPPWRTIWELGAE